MGTTPWVLPRNWTTCEAPPLPIKNATSTVVVQYVIVLVFTVISTPSHRSATIRVPRTLLSHQKNHSHVVMRCQAKVNYFRLGLAGIRRASVQAQWVAE